MILGLHDKRHLDSWTKLQLRIFPFKTRVLNLFYTWNQLCWRQVWVIFSWNYIGTTHHRCASLPDPKQLTWRNHTLLYRHAKTFPSSQNEDTTTALYSTEQSLCENLHDRLPQSLESTKRTTFFISIRTLWSKEGIQRVTGRGGTSIYGQKLYAATDRLLFLEGNLVYCFPCHQLSSHFYSPREDVMIHKARLIWRGDPMRFRYYLGLTYYGYSWGRQSVMSLVHSISHARSLGINLGFKILALE